MTVTLYTTHCPRCQVLATKLDQAAIKYDVCENVDEMLEKGIMSVPILEVDGNAMDFKQAVDWVNKGGTTN